MEKAREIVDAIRNAEHIVITSHRSPDGDSVGSSLGLLRFIHALGKDANICHPDPMPKFLEWVKGDDKVLDAEHSLQQVKLLMQEADLIFLLDYNDPDRLGEPMSDWIREAQCRKIMIDHHLFPTDFADITISDPAVCSTSQLVYELIEQSGELSKLDVPAGTALYLGIMTDTGSFRFSSVTPKTHRILAHLIETGVAHSLVHERTLDTNRVDQIRLRSYILAERLEVIENYRVAIISVTDEELKRFHYVKGDTEGLVNVALSLAGVDVAVFFTENEKGVKISFRSKGSVPVNKIAMEQFNGGGHLNAAGGSFEGSLQESIEHFKQLIPEYFHA